MLDDRTSDNSEYIIQLETRVRRMEAMMQMLLIRLGIDPREVAVPPPGENSFIREALLSGDRIQAIKLYHHIYGVSLKDAKDSIDAMESRHSSSPEE